MSREAVVAALLCLVAGSATEPAAVTVAAANSAPAAKAKADLICDGKDDQVELLASITRAARFDVDVDVSPSLQKTVTCYGRHSVEWLPGDYELGETLMIPDAADLVIRAEGAYFHYRGDQGDALVITGMNRCRYQFGTIETGSRGAAIRVRPTPAMPALMSFVGFTGLVGRGRKGIGLALDATRENVCVNRFEGTDIAGFDVGVFVGDADQGPNLPSYRGKCDTNWFWLSYVRLCKTCIWEQGKGIDDSVWEVNVDASIPHSTAIRTAAANGRWFVIMGTFGGKGTEAIVIDPGARDNRFDVRPPIGRYPWRDNSGNTTNQFLAGDGPRRVGDRMGRAVR
jgi:hypothetical protein